MPNRGRIVKQQDAKVGESEEERAERRQVTEEVETQDEEEARRGSEAEEGGETINEYNEGSRQQTPTFNHTARGCMLWSETSERK